MFFGFLCEVGLRSIFLFKDIPAFVFKRWYQRYVDTGIILRSVLKSCSKFTSMFFCFQKTNPSLCFSCAQNLKKFASQTGILKYQCYLKEPFQEGIMLVGTVRLGEWQPEAFISFVGWYTRTWCIFSPLTEVCLTNTTFDTAGYLWFT